MLLEHHEEGQSEAEMTKRTYIRFHVLVLFIKKKRSAKYL